MTTVELICVGTELLLGDIVNTNAAFLAGRCADLGLSCYYQSVVGDNAERLSAVLKCAMERSDVVILSGGLGPTEDDLTKEVAAKVCGRKLCVDDNCMERIAEYFSGRNIKPTENNWKQAKVPEGAIVLDNNNGTAPGIIIEAENARVILLPGPPNELVPMFEESVAPYLGKLTPGVIESQTVKICGVPESKVEDMIKDIIDAQTNPTIAPYAKTGEVHLRVTASAEDQKAARKLIKPVVKELKARFGGDIYTTEKDTTLEKAVVELLLANKLTVACAESCTGGMLSARLINVPGVSEVYKTGFVTYANKAKRKALGVKKGTLQKYGAVSSQTAEEMAKGAAFVTKADVTVAITGIAGPDGGTEEKPVGLVYIACNVKGKVTVKEFRFRGNRTKVREGAVSSALALMRSCILEYFSKVTFGKE
ncbi:MAG: competence/damage-inducible protein A [Lachnospiraceae bacterium]|nr:competence/damage-inducible protein A [Lachnospiraceae bacterium]